MENYNFKTNTMQVNKLTPFFKKLFNNKECCPCIIQVTPIEMPVFDDIYVKIVKGEDVEMSLNNILTFEAVIEYKVQHNPNIILNAQLTYSIKVKPIKPTNTTQYTKPLKTTQYNLIKQSAQLKISNGLSDCRGLLCSKPLIVKTEDEDLRWVVLETIKMCQDSNEELLKQYQCY